MCINIFTMNTYIIFILLFITTFLMNINAQWFIIKKDYPSNLMNYPNPGKRSTPDSFDCSIPYSLLRTIQEKTTWLFLCKNQASPLTAIDDVTTSSSSFENEFYPSHRLISHERRTLRSPPPYFFERPQLFRHRLRHMIKNRSN